MEKKKKKRKRKRKSKSKSKRDSTPCTGCEPKYGFNCEMDTATLHKQEDTFQERASLGVSEQCARGRSESRSHKSLAGTIPTVFGSSKGGSLGRPEHDRISETSLFSHSRRPKKLSSSSASTIGDLMLKEKRKGPRWKHQSNSKRQKKIFIKISREKAESAIREEDEARRKLWEMEAEVENRKWEQRGSELALYESYREPESRRLQLQQATLWADNAQRERIKLSQDL